MTGKRPGCRERLVNRLPFLTKTEKKVAEYTLAHFDEVLHCNVSDLAAGAGVSEATIVRFCRSAGYQGFLDFKLNIANDLIPVERQLDPRVEKGDDCRTICNKIFASEINVLTGTLDNLDFNLVEAVAKRIAECRNLLIFGTGGSQLVANDAMHKFLKVGVRSYVYQDSDIQKMSSALAGEGDVALCISFSGNTLNMISCMRNCKANGVYTVGIISQTKSQLVQQKCLDAVLYSSYDPTIFQSESVSTRIAQLAIIDAIVSNVAFLDYDGSLYAITRTRNATSENKD